MGRFVAMGVLAEIRMEKYKDCSNYDFKKDERKILELLSRYVDTDRYEVIISEDSMVLRINEDYFNQNIHDLLEEVFRFIGFNGCFFDDLPHEKSIDILNDFNQERYPINLIRHYDEYSDNEKIFIKSMDDDAYRLYEPYPSDKWLVYGGEDDFYENFRFKNELVILWEAVDKISAEDEVLINIMLNKMKTNYFTSPLSKNMIFTIIG